MPNLKHRLHKGLTALGLSAASLPLTACGVTTFTYVLCIILSASLGTYTGGLDMPYFSDTGRDAPAYWCFATGLTLGAMLYGTTHVAVWFWIVKPQVDATLPPRSLHWTPSRSAARLRAAAVAGPQLCGWSAPFLSILAIFDTAEWAGIHLLAAYVFFLLNVVGVWAYTITWRRVLRMEPEETFAACQRRKLGLALAFSVAFVVYLPVGLVVNCAFVRLTYAKCVVEGLGVSYCDARRLSSNPASADYALTVLWDYSDCVGTNEMRAGAQFCCIVLLLLFTASFSLDFSRLHGHMPQQALEAGSIRERPTPPPAPTYTQGTAITSGRAARPKHII